MGYFNPTLDTLNFKLYETHELLKAYIHSYWVIQKEDFSEAMTCKVLSDASMGFVVNFASPYKSTVNNQTFTCSERFTIDGLTKYPSYLRFEKELDLIGVRFKTAGAYIFFDEPMDSFLDKNVPFKNSESWPLDDLYEKLIQKNTTKEKIQLIEEFLINKLKAAKKKNSQWIFLLTQKVLKQKGDVSLTSLCDEFNINIRQVERTFKKEVGISPKLYIRIIRMRNAKDILSSLKIKDLTTTAHDAGFFDQAHFTREFKFFMSETPKNYYKNKLSMTKLCHYTKYLNNDT